MKPSGFVSSAARSFVITSVTTAALALSTAAQAPPGDSPQVQPSVRVEAEVHHDTSPPLWQIPPAPRVQGKRVHPVLTLPRRPQVNGGVAPADPVLQSSVGSPLLPTVTNFDGVGNGFSGPQGTFTVGAVPPDTNGSVGPNHYVQIVNTDFAVFNKSGTAIFGPVAINMLWGGFGGLCETDNDGDPIVVWDGLANRWVISQFAVTGANGTTTPFLECVAISTTGDPTGSYNRYAFAYSNFNDYPKIGVWPDAYYATFNLFNASGTAYMGVEVCAYDRAKMLAGQAATQQCKNLGTSYFGLLPASVDGANLPPAGSPNYLFSLDASVYVSPPPHTGLDLWKFHVDWTTPTNSALTGPTILTAAPFTLPCGDTGGTCVPQLNTSDQLDTLGDRPMFRLAYRNFGDHESLVVSHSVTAGAGVGERWYEIRSPGTTPTIFQQGTYAPADTNYRWMGSTAMDQAGGMALGFSMSSSSSHPEISLTGRLASDALGVMAQGEDVFFVGAGSQTGGAANGGNRWGDYSAMTIDPSDDCTFWYTNQYIPSDGEFNWKTRIASFKFPNCGANDFSISANPTSLGLTQGTGGSSTISTALVRGVAETIKLTVSDVPSGATASLNPTSVTAGGNSTLTVNAGTAAVGTYTLTIIGSAPSATHSTKVTLVISASAKIDTTTAVTSLQNPSVSGQSVTFTAKVSPVSGTGTPSGTVTFFDGGTAIGTGTLSGGQATFKTSALAVGNHTITTSYGGDANFNGSSGSLTGNPQVVNKANSATTVTSSANPSKLGQLVTFTATVSAVAPGAGTPTLTVIFLDSGSSIGTATLSGGKATFTTSSLAAGSHTITTRYAGDTNFNGSSGSLTGNPQLVIAPPTIGKAFALTQIPLNTSTALSFTVGNPNTSTTLNGVSFADPFPSGLQVDSPNGLTGTCDGGTITATAGSPSVSLTGATLAGNASCTFSLKVKGKSKGTKKNNTSKVTSTNGGTGNSASATISVVAPPTIAKVFGSTSFPLNGATTLKFTITNPNASTALSGIGFTDTLPTGLPVASPNGLTGTCGGGTITATAGSPSVSLTGATLAASATCTFTVNVKGTTTGTKNNTTSAITSNEGGSGNMATATTAVLLPPTIAKQFGAPTVLLNGTTSLTFTITAPASNPAALTGISFTDTLPSGLTVGPTPNLTNNCGGTATAAGGSSSISLSGGTEAPAASCKVSVTVKGTTTGTKNNSVTVNSTNGGKGNTATATIAVQ